MNNRLLPSYEIWNFIKKYEGRYEMSNRGRLRSWIRSSGSRLSDGSKVGRMKFLNNPVIIKSHPNKWGYFGSSIGGSIRNDHISVRMHREVAKIFNPNPNPLLFVEVDHVNGNKKCNEWWNLEWVDRNESIDRAFRLGLIVPAVGEQQANTKLTNEAVLLIYRHVAPTKKIAKGFGISTHTVLDIKRGRTWWHITGHDRHIKPSEQGRFKIDPNKKL
jgi:hypothetical protein